MQTSQAHQAVPRTRLHRGTPGARKTSGKTACVGARISCSLYCKEREREAHLEEAEGAERDEDDGEAEEDGLEDPSCAVDAPGDVALEAAESTVDLAACSCEAEHVWEARGRGVHRLVAGPSSSSSSARRSSPRSLAWSSDTAQQPTRAHRHAHIDPDTLCDPSITFVQPRRPRSTRWRAPRPLVLDLASARLLVRLKAEAGPPRSRCAPRRNTGRPPPCTTALHPRAGLSSHPSAPPSAHLPTSSSTSSTRTRSTDPPRHQQHR